jgi:serine/threonine protein phosphatase 1
MAMGRTFVIGDIHGAYRALIQCLDRSGFNREVDLLISLGDVCDGWPETKRCIDELLRIQNLIYILGNHDTWLLDWMKTGQIENIWYVKGGEASIHSYVGSLIPKTHISFLESAKLYHLIDNRLFVHAGIDPSMKLEKQSADIFLWDRMLARKALNHMVKGEQMKLSGFDEIYVGHTPVTYPHPVKACEIWLMDTGAGWSGCLSMMDIETKQFFVSDKVTELYPGIKGRSKG